jgi:Flp pilus assembly protein TadD
MPHINYGVALAKAGQYSPAKEQFETALKLRPGDSDAIADLQYLAKVEAHTRN